MKHRSPGLMNVAAKQVSVANMLSWPNPSTISRTSDSPIDPRENQSYTVQGDLWRVKTEGNDCDFHLELSPPNESSTADRVIVEIPQGQAFAQIRDSLIQVLVSAGDGDLRHKGTIDLTQSVPIQVTGFAFFDAFHYSRSNPKRGHGHGTAMVGTIWELHPVWQLQYLGGGPPAVLTAGNPPPSSPRNTGPQPLSDPQDVFDFSITKSFLQTLEDGHSIQPSFKLALGGHSSIHALGSDCEMHAVGTPKDSVLGWPNSVVVEPPNLCKFDPEGNQSEDTSSWLSLFDDFSGQVCQVTGFPRIFTEHATGAGGASNPNHVFELHPAVSIACGTQNTNFSGFLTAFPGMRAISPSTTTSCINDRQLEVRSSSDSQQYEFRETGGRCGNFAIVEVDGINPQWVREVGGGHSAIARISPDGQSATTLKLYTLAPSPIDLWLANAAAPSTASTRKFLHGLFTYDYYSILKTVHPRNQAWRQLSDWTPIKFPLAFVVFGEAANPPWDEQ